ncbi:MAG: amino acid ABC transporter substrate-binding protein [Deltaproteobacteria bacterium]
MARNEPSARVAAGIALAVWILASAPGAAAAGSGAASPIRIGGSLSLTGNYSAMGTMQEKGYRLWEREINAAGGLLGRPVTLRILDDRSDRNRVREIYEDLLGHHRVDLALSPYSSPLTLAVADIVERTRYPMLAAGASAPTIWETPRRYLFGVYSTADRYFIGFLELCAMNGLSRVSITGFPDSFSRTSAEGAKQWAESFGLSVDRYSILDSREPDALRAEAAAIDASTPDAVVVAGHLHETVGIRRALAEARARFRVFAGSVGPALPRFLERTGPLAEGVFGASQWEPDERIPYPGNVAFVKAFRSEYGEDPSYHAASAYAAMQLLAEAVRETGSLDRERIREELLQGEHGTILGPFRLRKDGTQIGHRSIIIQWQKGKKEIVWPERMRTARPVFP